MTCTLFPKGLHAYLASHTGTLTPTVLQSPHFVSCNSRPLTYERVRLDDCPRTTSLVTMSGVRAFNHRVLIASAAVSDLTGRQEGGRPGPWKSVTSVITTVPFCQLCVQLSSLRLEQLSRNRKRPCFLRPAFYAYPSLVITYTNYHFETLVADETPVVWQVV